MIFFRIFRFLDKNRIFLILISQFITIALLVLIKPKISNIETMDKVQQNDISNIIKIHDQLKDMVKTDSIIMKKLEKYPEVGKTGTTGKTNK
jgi:hypothetical protein